MASQNRASSNGYGIFGAEKLKIDQSSTNTPSGLSETTDKVLLPRGTIH